MQTNLPGGDELLIQHRHPPELNVTAQNHWLLERRHRCPCFLRGFRTGQRLEHKEVNAAGDQGCGLFTEALDAFRASIAERIQLPQRASNQDRPTSLVSRLASRALPLPS